MELVEMKGREIITDSYLVASKFCYKHANLVRIIKNVMETLEEFKGDLKSPLIIPYVTTEDRAYRGVGYVSYLMNRQFFSLLVMRMKGKKAYEWQLKFNSAFYELEEKGRTADSNSRNPEWIKHRGEVKIGRREETDVIKEFVEYATEQGSKSAKFYYKHITNATYAALDLMVQSKPKLRDTMNMYEISELLLAERLAKESLIKYMALKRNYKDIYESVKDDLLTFGTGLRIA